MKQTNDNSSHRILIDSSLQAEPLRDCIKLGVTISMTYFFLLFTLTCIFVYLAKGSIEEIPLFIATAHHELLLFYVIFGGSLEYFLDNTSVAVQLISVFIVGFLFYAVFGILSGYLYRYRYERKWARGLLFAFPLSMAGFTFGGFADGCPPIGIVFLPIFFVAGFLLGILTFPRKLEFIDNVSKHRQAS